MSIIRSILAEELQNSINRLGKYKQTLKSLPRGVLINKKIKGHKFYYEAYRDGKKVKFRYKGKLNKAEIAKYKEAQKLKVRYHKSISDIRRQIKFLERALHERKKRSRKPLSRSSKKAP